MGCAFAGRPPIDDNEISARAVGAGAAARRSELYARTRQKTRTNRVATPTRV